MKFTFKLRFHTHPGQSLWLTGNHPVLGNNDPAKALPLRYLDSEHWQVEIDLPAESANAAPIVYNYVLREPDGSLLYDWGKDKVIRPGEFGSKHVLIEDAWNDASFIENTFYTEPFRNVLLHRPAATEERPIGTATHRFKVKAPLLSREQTVCLVGQFSGAAQWNTANPVLLHRRAGSDFFEADLDLRQQHFPFEYKYGVYDTARNVFVRYEDGSNRAIHSGAASEKFVVINDGFIRLPANTWRGAGVAIPVFSLRSEKSFGVGEFSDLKLLADWCAKTGLKLIQLLPVNDTSATHTWTDSYPYATISAFALHPIYLNLAEVATGKNKALLEKLEPERQRLNALEALDYEAVTQAKLDFIKRIYPSQRATTFRSKAYKAFFAENKHWLVPYALFCHWRDEFGTPDFSQWPAHRVFSAEDASAAFADDSPLRDDVLLHCFIQFHLHQQLQAAADYAHSKGIILKGDIPIGIYRHGADAWQQPSLYHMDAQAGAPPDAFAVKGQNWGFPTYDWHRMKEDGFAWWKQRFEQMSHYFDAFRIDHILGFFRIWTIPTNAVEGILGRFVPAIPVRKEEFLNRGIPFHYERFVHPFISDSVLLEIFGTEAAFVKNQFLTPGQHGQWNLKPEYATQRQVEAFFATMDNSERNRKLKEGLFDLISNVILFPENDPHAFHFRFDVEKTSSFRHLDSATQAAVRELYIDYFFRRQDDFWKHEALDKLPALKRSTNMLICGEDLGLVPACVPDVMRQLALLSLEIQRMPKDLHVTFSRPANAPYLSVVTPSTHDMSTIRGWWLEDRNLTQRFYNEELRQAGTAPEQCEAWVNKMVVRQHMESPAMWSIFQLQDLLGIDGSLRRKNPDEERINVPANPKHYWRYRMHLPLETLLGKENFNAELSQLLAQSGRRDFLI